MHCRFIPFILEYNAEDIPLIILIILCIHIGSVLIIFLSIDLSNELRIKMTKQTISFGFSLILSIWVEYLLIIFYFAVYFVVSYNMDSATSTATDPVASGIVGDGLIGFGRWNFILLSIPGSIPWAMVLFANYQREHIYHHMVFTEIFENLTSDLPQSSVQKISDILGRNGIGKSLIPIPTTFTMEEIVDKLFGVVYLCGSDKGSEDIAESADSMQDDDAADSASDSPDLVDSTKLKVAEQRRERNGVKKRSVLQKQYQYLKLTESKSKLRFIKEMMKSYIRKQGIRVNTCYKLMFYHENIALFLSVCFGISRFVSCILMPIAWCYIMGNMDVAIASLYVVQHWIVYCFLALYGISFLPFAYNMYCVMSCGYYFFLIAPIKKPEDSGYCIGLRTRNGVGDGQGLLPRFIENSRRNKAIWDVMANKDIATLIIQFLPNAKCS